MARDLRSDKRLCYQGLQTPVSDHISAMVRTLQLYHIEACIRLLKELPFNAGQVMEGLVERGNFEVGATCNITKNCL